MPAKRFSMKQLQIDKATAQIIAYTAVASAVLVFTLFSVNTLLSQRSYQAKVIAQKEVAKKQLVANVSAKEKLVTAYKQFVGRQENVIGGNSTGNGQNDGDNARIILDALPSKYDFPALTTSIEKLLADSATGVQIQSITGTDDEVNQAETTVTTPVPVEIPFQLSVSGSYTSLEALSKGFERSIRPFNVTSLSISGSDSSLRLDMSAKTYYQPEKKVNIEQKVVK
jgi:hypothetical protein